MSNHPSLPTAKLRDALPLGQIIAQDGARKNTVEQNGELLNEALSCFIDELTAESIGQGFFECSGIPMLSLAL